MSSIPSSRCYALTLTTGVLQYINFLDGVLFIDKTNNNQQKTFIQEQLFRISLFSTFQT